jgi:hypothetical protein
MAPRRAAAARALPPPAPVPAPGPPTPQRKRPGARLFPLALLLVLALAPAPAGAVSDRASWSGARPCITPPSPLCPHPTRPRPPPNPSFPTPSATLPTLGLGKVSWLDRWRVWGYHSNVTTLAELDCASLAAPPAAAAAAAAACGPLFALPEALAPPANGSGVRGAALLAALARDAYPEAFGVPDGREYHCALARKLRALGASNVTFVQDRLTNAAVVRAGRHVLLVLRGTDGRLEEASNGEWASDGARLWLKGVRVHGGFLLTPRHVLPTVVRLLREAVEQAAAEAGGGSGSAERRVQAFAEDEAEQRLQEQEEELAAAAGGNATAAARAATAAPASNGTARAAAPQGSPRQLASGGSAEAPPSLAAAAHRAAGAVVNAANAAKAALRAALVPPGPAVPPLVFIVGHSRGGGLATLLAAMLASGYPRSVGLHLAGVYTFGAPKVRRRRHGLRRRRARPMAARLSPAERLSHLTHARPAPAAIHRTRQVGNKWFAREYGYHLGRITYAWWNEKDAVPFLPPQVWLGYRHLPPGTRWRVWRGACERARCGAADALAGRTCLARDCPPSFAPVCRLNQDADHPPCAYADNIRACLPAGALADCLASL